MRDDVTSSGAVMSESRWGIEAAISRLTDAALHRCYNAMLEAGLLGACHANVRAYEAIREIISAEMFSDPMNAVVWELYDQHYNRGLTPDVVTLRNPLAGKMLVPGRKRAGERLEDEPEWLDAGKILSHLLSAMIPVPQAPSYGQSLRDLWVRRNAAKRALELWRVAISEASVLGHLADVADSLDSLRSGPKNYGGPVQLAAAMEAALKSAEASAAAGGISGVRSGFGRLDRLLRGFQAGRLYYLAGRPGMGKSALAQSMLRGDASEAGALVFSLEMDEPMLGERELAMDTGVDIEAMAFGEAGQPSWDTAVAALGPAAARRIWIDARPRLTPAEVLMTARRHMRRNPIKLVVVDHIHLMRPPRELIRANRTEQLEGISAALKEGAKELGVAMLVLAQLSRGVDQREDKRPDLPDLRSSGALEQDADAVMFVYRPGYYTAQEKPESVPVDASPDDPRHRKMQEWYSRMERERATAEVILAKNRAGRVGTVQLLWDAERTLFTEYGASQSTEE